VHFNIFLISRKIKLSRAYYTRGQLLVLIYLKKDYFFNPSIYTS
jgi:hypothetical protein